MLDLRDADPLLTLAVVIVAGIASGRLARLVGLPSITGQIVVGVLIGPVLEVFDRESIHGLQPLTHFALGLMAVTVGAHLNIKRMRNAGKRLALLLVAEATITPLLVLVILSWMPSVDWATAAMLAAISVSTAPATIVALVKETRARGVFVKTLVAAVALNNFACILLFELARSLTRAGYAPAGDIGLSSALVEPGYQIFGALFLGGGAALAMQLLHRFAVKPEALSTAGILAILLTSGLSDHFEVSPLLSCLVLGIVQTNLTPAREQLVDALFANFEPAILAIFFTLAGMELELGLAKTAGLVGVLFFATRIGGKLLSVRVAMHLAGATENVKRYLGLALIPQAGLAIGLVLLVQDDPLLDDRSDMKQLLLAVVLTVVTLNEIIGPLLTKSALEKSGEAGLDRSRLLDFLQEENIVVGLRATTKTEAIERMVDHLIRSHHLDVDRKTMLDTVLQREAQASTALGGGLAVPHAILPGEHKMVGVMGLTSEGLVLDAPDGKPVHCMVLLGTSESERPRHLQVLATLARTIGIDPTMQDRLFHASTAAHAADILHGEESEAFNVFLDDEG